MFLSGCVVRYKSKPILKTSDISHRKTDRKLQNAAEWVITQGLHYTNFVPPVFSFESGDIEAWIWLHFLL